MLVVFFTESTMQWLKEQLKDIQNQKKIPLIAMHHNLAIHNELLNSGYTIQNHKDIAKLFAQYHVPFVLSGHIHCQNIRQINGIYDIDSSSLLDAPLEYGVIELYSHKMDYHTQSLSISKDANDYFDILSSHKFSEELKDVKDSTHREAILDVIVQANRYYFTGCMDQYVADMKAHPEYQYLQTEDVNFFLQYLESMLKEMTSSQQLSITY